jgi:lipopolysaccharide export system protein LptA
MTACLSAPIRPKAVRVIAASLAAALLLAAPSARAEKADREKPINLEADHMTIDDLKKIQVYEGKVVLTQGTLSIRADKIVVTQDAEGFNHGVATVVPGGALATFREKLDGKDEYVEGWGERIEYDAKADKADLFVHARVKRNLDDVRGDHISYNGKTEFYQVDSGEKSANPNNPDGKVRVTIMPKTKEAPKDASKDAPKAVKPEAERGDLGLKPAAAIAHPRDE